MAGLELATEGLHLVGWEKYGHFKIHTVLDEFINLGTGGHHFVGTAL